MDGKFNLEIDLGNVAMLRPVDIAIALHQVADRLVDEGRNLVSASIRDLNGNTVGFWEIRE